MPDLGDDDVHGTLPKVQSAPEFPISRSSCSDDSEDDLSQSENDGRVDKIYTVGCFDLFHRGHINLLKNMRTLGKEVIEGERERPGGSVYVWMLVLDSSFSVFQAKS